MEESVASECDIAPCVEARDHGALDVIAVALDPRSIIQHQQRESTTFTRQGDSFKVQLAAKLRAETTVTVGWIAERLNMGVRGHLTHLLYRHGRQSA